MGRGGRGGGGGGRSFGGGESRGFGMHSSSSHRGGYNSSSYRNSYSSNGRFHGGYHTHINYFGGGSYYPSQRTPLSIVVSIAIWTLIIFTLVVSFSSTNSESGVTKSTVKREKLESTYVSDDTIGYADELGWIGNSSKVKTGLRNFYKKTGVVPYVYITDNIDGDTSGNYTQDECEKFGNKIYDRLFNDEGHLLLVFCEYRTSEYNSFYIVGNASKTVIDDEAGEILLDYIDKYYYSDLDEAEFFGTSFEKAGNRIMDVQHSKIWIAVVAVVLLIALIIIIKYRSYKKKKKLEELKAAQDILNTPLHEYGDSTSNDAEDVARKYEN